MTNDVANKRIKAAVMYGDPANDFLNACTTINRLETLIDDVRAIKEMLNDQMARKAVGLHGSEPR